MKDTVQALGQGSQFGTYCLRRLLGYGGMGQVYEAHDTSSQRTVALKVLPPVFSYDLMFSARLQRQVRVVGQLPEPHIVPISDHGEIDGQHFLEMPLVPGANLSDLLKREGRLAAPRAVAIVRQLASALDAAHAIGVIHGDVKPTNILITPADFAYLADFGIANAAPSGGVARVIGSAAATWKYTAPERFSDCAVNNKLDIYALACVLYECLTGSPPYWADRVGALISAHLMEPIPQPSRMQSTIPTALDDVIARGMAKDPVARYGSAGELTLSAYEALSAADQQRATDILQSSQESTGADAESELRFAFDVSSSPAEATPHSSADTGHFEPDVSESPASPSAPAGSTQTLGTLPRLGLDQAGWSGEFGTPAAGLHPLWATPHKRTRRIALGAAVVVTMIVLSGAVIWLLRPPQPAPTLDGANSATSTASSSNPSTAASQARLLSLLPRGYLPGVCKPVTAPEDALAEVSCDENSDPDGPLSATYMLFRDATSLGSALNRIIRASSIIECPGRIQSPGSWHRTATPDKASGVLLCGTQQGNPLVGWTDNAERLIGVIKGQSPGPGIDQLYGWWMSHS
jgi:serine/threonine kinase PknH